MVRGLIVVIGAVETVDNRCSPVVARMSAVDEAVDKVRIGGQPCGWCDLVTSDGWSCTVRAQGCPHVTVGTGSRQPGARCPGASPCWGVGRRGGPEAGVPHPAVDEVGRVGPGGPESGYPQGCAQAVDSVDNTIREGDAAPGLRPLSVAGAQRTAGENPVDRGEYPAICRYVACARDGYRRRSGQLTCCLIRLVSSVTWL